MSPWNAQVISYNFLREQFLDRPNVIGQPGGHCGRPLARWRGFRRLLIKAPLVSPDTFIHVRR
jgi:hypothetical protein